jgi:glutamyl/glutaminyl-tRNA synthetase
MNISHVIRGEEWLPSAPLHVLLYRYLGWETVMPKFAHLPLLLKPDGNGKLSKRDGDRLGFPVFPLQWVDPITNEMSSGYKQNGYLPEAVINMLAFLGWNPGGTKEIYTLQELVDVFTIERISHGGAKFDAEKAKWFNHEYIKSKTNDELAVLLKPAIDQHLGVFELSYISSVCGLVKDRLILLNDLVSSYKYLFENPSKYAEENLAKIKAVKEVIQLPKLIETMHTMKHSSGVEIEIGIKHFTTENGIKAGDLMKFLRISLVGELSGPAVHDIIQLLGVEKSLERINNCFNQL